MTVSGSWLVRPRPQPAAAVRMFCVPYAGSGAAAYRGWAEAAGAHFDVCYVQLPGRENRFRERPFTSVPPLVEALGDALLPFLDKPFALFGHSLGGVIAFELARLLCRRGSPPLRLFVSGSRAPHLPPARPPVRHLPDAELLREVHRRYESVPDVVMNDPELQELLVPALRADLTLLETYEFSEADPLPCGIDCFGARGDRMVDGDALAGWREHTRQDFRLHMYDGNHLFLQSARPEMLSVIAGALNGGVAR